MMVSDQLLENGFSLTLSGGLSTKKTADEFRRLWCLTNCHDVQTGLTFSARGPFGPCPALYDTR
jgi:hypothetical protein